MEKVIVFIGGSGSGKTTIITEMVRKYPDQFKKVITYTSRTPRNDEIDGVDYKFRPGEYFIKNTDIVLKKKTLEGFYYGTKRSDLFSNFHNLLLTLRPTGIKTLINLVGCQNIVVVHLSISNKLKIERMRERGDSEEMIKNRLLTDPESNVEFDFGKIPIIELEATQKIQEKIDLILKHISD